MENINIYYPRQFTVCSRNICGKIGFAERFKILAEYRSEK